MSVASKVFDQIDSSNLTMDEIDELIRKLSIKKFEIEKSSALNDLFVESGKIVACPCCGVASKTDIIKWGKGRYRCKMCNKTFQHTTGTVFSYSRLSSE
jgi:transposase-like protein